MENQFTPFTEEGHIAALVALVHAPAYRAGRMAAKWCHENTNADARSVGMLEGDYDVLDKHVDEWFGCYLNDLAPTTHDVLHDAWEERWGKGRDEWCDENL